MSSEANVAGCWLWLYQYNSAVFFLVTDLYVTTIFFHLWSNRSGWESCVRAFFFPGLNNLQGRYLSLPSCGSFHEVWHDCCNVHTTFSGYMSSCQRSLDGCHYLEMGHGVIPPQNTSQSLFCGTYHWTSARPALLTLFIPPPFFFPPLFPLLCLPCVFFSPFQISSISAECVSSALGNAHKMLDRLLTQRILSATTYSCSWPPDCVGSSSLPFLLLSISATTHSYFDISIYVL